MRKHPLVSGNYYHIINRSIAKFGVFKDPKNCLRFQKILNLYRFTDFTYSYSTFIRFKAK